MMRGEGRRGRGKGRGGGVSIIKIISYLRNIRINQHGIASFVAECKHDAHTCDVKKRTSGSPAREWELPTALRHYCRPLSRRGETEQNASVVRFAFPSQYWFIFERMRRYARRLARTPNGTKFAIIRPAKVQRVPKLYELIKFLSPRRWICILYLTKH